MRIERKLCHKDKEKVAEAGRDERKRKEAKERGGGWRGRKEREREIHICLCFPQGLSLQSNMGAGLAWVTYCPCVSNSQ